MADGNIKDAYNLFNEAHGLEKWRDVYGSVTMSNLAYICAKMGNFTKAKEYLGEFYTQYGYSDYSQDPEEYKLIGQAQELIDAKEQLEAQSGKKLCTPS